MKVLVLAGTTEARRLVEALAERPGIEVEASLAGRTSAPVELPCPVRTGGFGGPDALAAVLVGEGIDLLVDATHPFARTMPVEATEAARIAGVPRLRLRRPGFVRMPDDPWIEVDDAAQAADALRASGATRPLLTIGSSELVAFRDLPGAHLVVRTIEAVELPDATAIRDRGPFTLDDERALLRSERIDALVTKDSGGDDAKLRAARAEGVTVVIVRRPPDVDGPLLEDVGAALAWIEAHQGLPPSGAHGGDADAVARWLGVAADAVLDLSASLNPFAPDVAGVVARAASAVGRYPDATTATAAIADAFGVDADRLVLTNGGAEAIALLATLMPHGWVEDPEFSLYRRHLAEVSPDAPRWRSNPSNPLGRLAAPGDTAAVWDEAFHPLATGRWTRGDDQAWRLGSLTKVWACPGLRLGYVIAPTAAEAESVRALQPRWSVNGLALEAVPELLERTDLPGWAEGIASQRAVLVEALQDRGLAVRATDACWVLVDEPELRERLAPHGVLVRDCTSFGMPGTARVAVPDDDGVARLLAAVDASVGGR